MSVKEWNELRYGMFIHWGLYSLMGRGEWAMWSEAIDKDEYRKLMYSFKAEDFDPHAWARTAKEAGMKYMVLTTRHHDGFSLWDSPSSFDDFDAVHSAVGRDLVREYVDACREEGLKVGLYYSPLDWRFPGFFFPRMYAANAELLRKQTFEQVRELLTNYGKIDILWFDGGEDFWLCHGRDLHSWKEEGPMEEHIQVPNFWREKVMFDMIHSLQPDIVVNNRYGMRDYGDYLTPEGKIGPYNILDNWESCYTLNRSWGYVPGEPMSVKNILHLLLKAATGDGNFLLNIGPEPSGKMPETHVERLKQAGAWLKMYGESVYGTRGGPFINDETGGMTLKGSRIYVHIWDWPSDTVVLPRIDAQIINVSSPTAESLTWSLNDNQLSFSVNENDRLAIDTIVAIDLDRPAEEVRKDILWRVKILPSDFGKALIVEDKMSKTDK